MQPMEDIEYGQQVDAGNAGDLDHVEQIDTTGPRQQNAWEQWVDSRQPLEVMQPMEDIEYGQQVDAATQGISNMSNRSTPQVLDNKMLGSRDKESLNKGTDTLTGNGWSSRYCFGM